MNPSLPEIRRRYLAAFRLSQVSHRFSDVLVLGSGVAGLSAALAASSRPDIEVLLVSKSSLYECATHYAQGGVAAVLSPERMADSVQKHFEDSVEAAAGLAEEEAVRITVSEGVERVRELIELGAEFDRDEAGRIHFTREGGHCEARILHRGDSTGSEVERTLLEAVRRRDNIRSLEHTFAVDLLTSEGTCQGALLYRPGGDFQAAWAPTTILATGGAGRLYRETTNPSVCTGDGLAMAFRAGAVLQDLEFVQFHPTTLYVAGAERFLITEAARGEGGVLRDGTGRAFMERFHPLRDLAPRDIVARAIVQVMKETGENRVWLDLSSIPPQRARERFPNILEFCSSFGIEPPRDPIPVRPSAHYSIGGVRTSIRGETSVDSLLAAGEVASTGLHGANRLGSNSILEGLVFGNRAGALAAERARKRPAPVPFFLSRGSWDLPDEGVEPPRRSPGARELNREDVRRSLKSLLWYRVGVVRSGEGLEAAREQMRSWIPYCLGTRFDDPESWSLQNMLLTSWLITTGASMRQESRGAHYRSDFPDRDDAHWQKHSQISRDTPTLAD